MHGRKHFHFHTHTATVRSERLSVWFFLAFSCFLRRLGSFSLLLPRLALLCEHLLAIEMVIDVYNVMFRVAFNVSLSQISLFLLSPPLLLVCGPPC